MLKIRAAAALTAATLGSLAAPASAFAECQHGDVSCYQTCYLPHVEGKNIYWVNC